jgi:hypothetical protein
MYESHMLMSPTGSLIDNPTTTNYTYYSRGAGGNAERVSMRLETADVNMYAMLNDSRGMDYEVRIDGDSDSVRRAMMEQSWNELHSVGHRKVYSYGSYGSYDSAGEDEMMMMATTATATAMASPPFAPLYRHDYGGWALGEEGHTEGNRQVYGEEWVAYCCGKSFKDYYTLIEHDQTCHQDDLVDDIVSIDPDGNIIYHNNNGNEMFLEAGDDENNHLSPRHSHQKWQDKNINVNVAVDEEPGVRAKLRKVIMTYRTTEETTAGSRKGPLKSKFVGNPSYSVTEKDYDGRENGPFYQPISTEGVGGGRAYSISSEERRLDRDIEMVSSHNLTRTKHQRGPMMMMRTSVQPVTDTSKLSLGTMSNNASGDGKNETPMCQAPLLLTSSSSIVPAAFQDTIHTTVNESDVHGDMDDGDGHQRSSLSAHSQSSLDGQLIRAVKPPTTLSEGEVICSMKLTRFGCIPSSRLRASSYPHHHPLDAAPTSHDPYSPKKPSRKTSQLYQCSVDGCRKIYTSTNGLRYHEEHGHKEPTADMNKPYTCHITDCAKRFKSANGLSYHLKNAHKKSKNLHPALLAAAATAGHVNQSITMMQPPSRPALKFSTFESTPGVTPPQPSLSTTTSIGSLSLKPSPSLTVQHSRISSQPDPFPLIPPVTRQLNATSPLNDLANSIATMRQRASSTRELAPSPLDRPKNP